MKCLLHVSLFLHHLKIKKLKLLDDKILDGSKLESIYRREFHWAQMVQFFSDRVENIVGKGENTGFQHFHLLPQHFESHLFQGLEKPVIVWERVNPLHTSYF